MYVNIPSAWIRHGYYRVQGSCSNLDTGYRMWMTLVKMTMSSQDGEDDDDDEDEDEDDDDDDDDADDDDDDDEMVIMMTCPVSNFYILFQLFDTDLRYWSLLHSRRPDKIWEDWRTWMNISYIGTSKTRLFSAAINDHVFCPIEKTRLFQGGRAVIEGVQKNLKLTDRQIRPLLGFSAPRNINRITFPWLLNLNTPINRRYPPGNWHIPPWAKEHKNTHQPL